MRSQNNKLDVDDQDRWPLKRSSRVQSGSLYLRPSSWKHPAGCAFVSTFSATGREQSCILGATGWRWQRYGVLPGKATRSRNSPTPPPPGVSTLDCGVRKITSVSITSLYFGSTFSSLAYSNRVGYQHACTCVCSAMSYPLWPHGLWPTRLLCPWGSPGKNTGAGSHSLLQGVFPIQGSNPHLLPRKQNNA